MTYRPLGHGAAERAAARPKRRTVVESDSDLYRSQPGKHVIHGWALFDRLSSDIYSAKCPCCGQFADVTKERMRRYSRCRDCEVKRVGAYADVWHGRKGHGPNATANREWHTLNQPHFNAMTVPGERLREYSVELVGDLEP